MTAPASTQTMHSPSSSSGTLSSSRNIVREEMALESLDKVEKPPAVRTDNDVPPDGGVAAWLVVFGGWCTMFCSFGWINSVGTFQSYYETTLLRQYSATTISWIPSLQIFFMLAMGPIIGQIYDRFGPRHLLVGGSFLHVFGLMMASISTEYYQVLLSQGMCSAIGAAALFQPAMNAIPSWFNQKRGAAYGIVSTGSSIGGVIFPIMVSRLIGDVGYGWTMRISAFLILALLVIAILTVRSRVPPRPHHPLSRETLLHPFRELKLVLLVVGYIFLTFGVFIPINYLVVQAMAAGMSAGLAQYLVAMLNAASLFGRMAGGIFSDKIGAYNIFLAVCALAGILVLALWIPASGNAAIIVFACLFGFASGTYVTLGPALVVRISPFQEIGYRTGLLFLFASVGGLTTSPIAGAILQHDGGSYTGMKIFSGVVFLVGTGFVLGTRLLQTGFVLQAKF